MMENPFNMSTDEMIDTILADEKAVKLEPGMLVDIYDYEDIDDNGRPVFEGKAYLIQPRGSYTGANQWFVRFEGQITHNIRYINPENAISIDQPLQDLLTRYRDLSNRLQPAMNDLENLKQAVKDKAMELGESMEIEGAKVQLRDGYERTSWDGKKLEGLALVHPEINQCKKMTTVNPTAAVSVE